MKETINKKLRPAINEDDNKRSVIHLSQLLLGFAFRFHIMLIES